VQEKMDVDIVAAAGLQAGCSDDAPVKVAAPGVGAEDAVVGKERWEEIRRPHVAGMNVAAIARGTDLDRKTVRRCLRQSQWRPYRRRPARRCCRRTRRGWSSARRW